MPCHIINFVITIHQLAHHVTIGAPTAANDCVVYGMQSKCIKADHDAHCMTNNAPNKRKVHQIVRGWWSLYEPGSSWCCFLMETPQMYAGG